MKINTVNVVEYERDCILSIVSFQDKYIGNKEAEKLFVEKVKENGGEMEEMKDFLDEGCCLLRDYQIFLVHSS